ncbi:hypothetical protein ABRP29_07680 [Pseudomonas sp. WHRI 8822A]|uniref:hypothetical protein n=1 Tax=Pseudomonas sp. WHRI 8822A TaxID=3162568 RepID=UPI0032EA9118
MMNKESKKLTVGDVLQFPKWSPLSEMVGVADASRFIGRNLYKLSGGLYLLLTNFSGASLEKASNGPFVVGVIWGAGDGAVKRAFSLNIECDEGDIKKAPREFLPSASSGEYGSILKALEYGCPKHCLETAVYRVASDGAFVNRVIEAGGFKFFFRGGLHDDTEPPYAVLRKLEEK